LYFGGGLHFCCPDPHHCIFGVNFWANVIIIKNNGYGDGDDKNNKNCLHVQ
jgi:hypothetical protein